MATQRHAGKLALALVLALVLSSVGQAADDVEQDSANLQVLLRQVESVLPPGWQAAITPDVPTEVLLPRRCGEGWTHLVIWYHKKMSGHPIAPGMPPLSEDSDAYWQLRLPSCQLCVTDFVTPEEYAAAARENAHRWAAREEFYRRLPGARTRGSFKGDYPPSPASIDATSAEEKELVRQYSLLWGSTVLRELPTHHYRSLAFALDSLPIRFRDPDFDRQASEVREAMIRSLHAYE